MSFSFEPGEGDAPRMRLDQYLIGEGLELSRSQLERVIKAGDVTVNGTTVKPGHKLKRGDRIEVVLRPPAEARAVAQDIAIDILYQDDHLLVVDKPAGLVVHP
ncbi:S4 domain-containing protein, partial [Haliangium sp.]|uniref:S4 domain-containing protein n=1 Tax=Haliangium sp. TaxID=2663208 RepID=UPI003D0B6E44